MYTTHHRQESLKRFNRMNNSLYRFLSTIRVDEYADFNFHNYTNPVSNFYVDNSNLGYFWDTYCQSVADAPSDSSLSKLGLAENCTTNMPLVVDMEFEFDPKSVHQDSFDDIFTESFYWRLVHCYQVAIGEILESTHSRNELYCVLLTHDHHYGTKNINFRIRLQFPYCVCETKAQMGQIRGRVLSKLRSESVIGLLGATPVNNWEKIIHKTVDKPVILYGSVASDKHPVLELYAVYGIIDEECLQPGSDKQPARLEIEEAFDPRSHSHNTSNQFDFSQIDCNQENSHWIPLFLSMNFWGKVLRAKSAPSSARTPRLMSPSMTPRVTTEGTPNEFNSASDMDMLVNFLKMIPIQHWSVMNTWLELGAALYHADGSDNYAFIGGNISDTSNSRGYSMWLSVANDAGLVPPEGFEPETTYLAFYDSPITYKTVAWYARSTAPEKYAAWQEKWIDDAMYEAVSGNDDDLARAFYRCFWLKYVCVDAKKDRWFEFRQNRWVEDTSRGVALKREISNAFVKRFEKKRTKLSGLVDRERDKAKKEQYELYHKKVNKIIDELKNAPKKSRLMQSLPEYFFNPIFTSSIDTNQDLFCCTNCVLQMMADGKVLAREGKPEDYVTKCCMIPFPDRYNEKHEKVKSLNDWLSMTYTDPETRHYVKKYFASHLRGGNSNKIFAIFTGGGNNSKSMIVMLFEKTFGQYCVKIPVTALTRRQTSSSGPTPEWARTAGAKVVFTEEPEEGAELETALIKAVTGKGSFFTRFLNENGGDVVAGFKFNVCCNKIPAATTGGKAFHNRVVIVPHSSTWSMDAPIDIEEQFKTRTFREDPFFESKVRDFAQAFLWDMVQNYSAYIKEGLQKPTEVAEATRSYIYSNDIYKQFEDKQVNGMPNPKMTGNLLPIRNSSGEIDKRNFIKSLDLSTAFRAFFTVLNPDSKKPTHQSIEAEFAMRWGKPDNGVWYGYSLRDTESHQANMFKV